MPRPPSTRCSMVVMKEVDGPSGCSAAGTKLDQPHELRRAGWITGQVLHSRGTSFRLSSPACEAMGHDPSARVHTAPARGKHEAPAGTVSRRRSVVLTLWLSAQAPSTGVPCSGAPAASTGPRPSSAPHTGSFWPDAPRSSPGSSDGSGHRPRNRRCPCHRPLAS